MSPFDQDTDDQAFPGRGIVVGRGAAHLGHPDGFIGTGDDLATKPLGETTPLGPVPEITEPAPVRAHLSFGVTLNRCANPAFAKNTTHFEVRQGSVYNCPLPALLAAMVYTKQLGKITITEKSQPAISKFKGKSSKVDRYFTVKFPGHDAIKVTDRFWGSGACKMEYARSTEKALWVSLIEKAYVKLRAGNTYEKLSSADKSPDANTVVEDLTGSEAQVVVVSGETKASLRKHLQTATKTPMIARLHKPNSNNAHAYTVEGLDPHVPDEVLLFDALKGVSLSLGLDSFKEQYSHLLFP
ncbi:MAG: C2 family cysteine protease [Pseudomonadota bacterium]